MVLGLADFGKKRTDFGKWNTITKADLIAVIRTRKATEQCIHSMVIQGVVKQKTMFSSAVGHSGAHWSKLRTTFGFSRTYNCNKIYKSWLVGQLLSLKSVVVFRK